MAKRLMGAALCALMALSLGACAARPSVVYTARPEGTRLTVLFGESTSDPGVGDMLRAHIEQHFPEVELEWESVDWGEQFSGRLNAKIASGETPDLIILISAGYELIFAFLIAATIIHGTMFRKTVFFPGDSPSHIFSDKSLQALKDFDDVRTRYIKGWHLEEIQFRIMQNKKEQLHEVTVYRRALALCLTAILSGAALVTTLFLFGL